MRKPHRIFIAINLPRAVKRELLQYKEKWPELPARWTTAENLHLTLAFLGNTSDQELLEVCLLMQEVGERRGPFSVTFTKIVYGPFEFAQGKPLKRPRMIWVVGESTPELLALQKDVAKTLGREKKQPFSPHLTLARLRMLELRDMEAEELPDINEEISVSFEAQSIEVMESRLKRSGAEYDVMQSIPLQKA